MINKADPGYTLKVTSGSLTFVTTDPINVTNAPADHLAITTRASPHATVLAGQTFGMVVAADDPFGNVDIGFSGQLTLSHHGRTLTGTATINVANGMATFPGLAIDTTGTFQILATSSTSLQRPPCRPRITVTPAAASTVRVGERRASHLGRSQLPFGAALDLEDQYGNLETSLNETVSVALDNDPNGANLGGTRSPT